MILYLNAGVTTKCYKFTLPIWKVLLYHLKTFLLFKDYDVDKSVRYPSLDTIGPPTFSVFNHQISSHYFLFSRLPRLISPV